MKIIKRIEEKSAIIFYQAIRKDGNQKLTLNRYINDWRSNWNKDFSVFKNEDNSFDDEAIINYFTPLFEEYYSKWGQIDRKSMHDIRSEFLTVERMPIQVSKIAKWRGVTVLKYKGGCMGIKLGGFCIKNTDTKRIVAGKEYELDINDVCEFLGIDIDNNAEYKYNENKDKGYRNWKGIKANSKAKNKTNNNPNNAKHNKKKTNKPKSKGAK